jgi:alpha-glucosidase
VLGRDGRRLPLPWEKDAPGYRFGVGATTWLPQPDNFGDLAVGQQTGRADSTLELYRIAARDPTHPTARRRRCRSVVGLGPDVVAFDVATGNATTRAVVNLGEKDCPITPHRGAHH